MDEAKRRGLEKLQESLILAAEDMDQATAAATALRADTSKDAAWRRALETAIAVSYMRPFTDGAWRLPGKYVPKRHPPGTSTVVLRTYATRSTPTAIKRVGEVRT